jgi:hypothetical protein
MLTLCVLALCVATAAALSAVFRHQWCPLGCLSRQPKAYGDEAISPDYDPLLPRLSPIVYCYTGTSPDLQETLHALAAARTSVEVNDALPGAALEWMLTTLDDAQQFVALCKGHVDLSAIMVCNLASLVVGLQRFAESEPIAQFITDCFRAKVAGDLLRLKHEIEKRVPVYDVVYNRIESKTLQECILTHMELQARVLRATPGYEAPVKLLSFVLFLDAFYGHDTDANQCVYERVERLTIRYLPWTTIGCTPSSPSTRVCSSLPRKCWATTATVAMTAKSHLTRATSGRSFSRYAPRCGGAAPTKSSYPAALVTTHVRIPMVYQMTVSAIN